MNVSLLETIDKTGKGLLATILETEGHTYKKAGEKALFEVDNPFPLCGNLGSLCVDQDIVRNGKEAWRAGAPRVIEIDTSDPSDAQLGYGTYCGGKMKILLEPIDGPHKAVYRELHARLQGKRSVSLCHDLETGEISMHEASPEPRSNVFIESIAPPRDLFIVGATPLARELAGHVSDMDFRLHIIDWRAAHLATFEGPGFELHDDTYPFASDSLVVVLTHSFERDKTALGKALASGSAYIGLLSSRTRRDALFADMVRNGVSEKDLERVSSPVGIDIHARTDPELAVAIAAELVEFVNR
ncbi:MAG: XdhC family protein [Candidatus Krumholzibacteriia bacterium]